MIRRSLYVLTAMVLLASPLMAQRNGGRASTRGEPTVPTAGTFSMATARQVSEHANVAQLLVDKKKKVGLSDAGLDSMKALAASIDARNAPHIARFDTLRSEMRRVSQESAQSGGPSAGARETMQALGETIRGLETAREADIAAAMALIPADKQEEARKLITDQGEDLRRDGAPRGGRPAAPPARPSTGGGRRP